MIAFINFVPRNLWILFVFFVTVTLRSAISISFFRLSAAGRDEVWVGEAPTTFSEKSSGKTEFSIDGQVQDYRTEIRQFDELFNKADFDYVHTERTLEDKNREHKSSQPTHSTSIDQSKSKRDSLETHFSLLTSMKVNLTPIPLKNHGKLIKLRSLIKFQSTKSALIWTQKEIDSAALSSICQKIFIPNGSSEISVSKLARVHLPPCTLINDQSVTPVNIKITQINLPQLNPWIKTPKKVISVSLSWNGKEKSFIVFVALEEALRNTQEGRFLLPGKIEQIYKLCSSASIAAKLPVVLKWSFNSERETVHPIYFSVSWEAENGKRKCIKKSFLPTDDTKHRAKRKTSQAPPSKSDPRSALNLEAPTLPKYIRRSRNTQLINSQERNFEKYSPAIENWKELFKEPTLTSIYPDQHDPVYQRDHPLQLPLFHQPNLREEDWLIILDKNKRSTLSKNETLPQKKVIVTNETVKSDLGMAINSDFSGNQTVPNSVHLPEKQTYFKNSKEIQFSNVSFPNRNHNYPKNIENNNVNYQNITFQETPQKGIGSNGREFANGCEPEWTELNSLCYKVIIFEYSWGKAEEYCQKIGGHLISVTSSDISQLADDLIKKKGHLITLGSSFWIGATDGNFENAFTWVSGSPFSYADWFPGWEDQNHYSSQPSDDGLADEDCVELRKTFRLSTKGMRVTTRFFWNDRNCEILNKFICEKTRLGVSAARKLESNCNISLSITPGAPSITFMSPGFPSNYSPSTTCIVKIEAPVLATITLIFDAFHLEDHPQCSFDSLEILEPTTKSKKIICGNWSDKLKLLRYVSTTPQVSLTLKTDPAHSFMGFKLRVIATTGGSGCGSRWQMRHGNTCLLASNDPQVTWNTASRICKEAQGKLLSIEEPITVDWINMWLQSHPRFSPETRYWIGGQYDRRSWFWEDRKTISKQITDQFISPFLSDSDLGLCLSMETSNAIHPNIRMNHFHPQSHLDPTPHFCDGFGGYICSKLAQEHPIRLNQTIRGLGGNVTSPGYPGQYPNDMHMTIHLVGPERTRVIAAIKKLNVEYQAECLYDYVTLGNLKDASPKRYCGHLNKKTKNPVVVSSNNEMIVTFHTDWSGGGSGSLIEWWTVDTHDCPMKLFNKTSSVLSSPNFPHFNLANIHCTFLIEAPINHKIWLQFDTFEVSENNEDSKFSKEKKTKISAKKEKFENFMVSNPTNSESDTQAHFLFRNETDSIVETKSSIVVGDRSNNTPSSFPKAYRHNHSAVQNFVHYHPYNTFQMHRSSQPHRKHRLKNLSSGSSYSQRTKSSSDSISYPEFSSSPERDTNNNPCKSDYVDIILSEDNVVRLCGEIPEGTEGNLAYISHSNVMKIILHTSRNSKGRGFKAHYKTGKYFDEGTVMEASNALKISNKGPISSEIRPVNFPMASTSGVKFTRHLIAPPGFRLNLLLHHVDKVAHQGDECPQDYVEIEDWYAGEDGIKWRICSFDAASTTKISIPSTLNSLFIREVYVSPKQFSESETDSKSNENSHRKNEVKSNESKPIDELYYFSNSTKNIVLVEEGNYTKIEPVDQAINKSLDYIEVLNADKNLIDLKPILGKLNINFPLPIMAHIFKRDFQNNQTKNIDRTENKRNNLMNSIPKEDQPKFHNLREENLFNSNSSVEESGAFYFKALLDDHASDNNANYGHQMFLVPEPSSIVNFKISYQLLPDPQWINRSLGHDDESVKRTSVSSCHPSPCLRGGRCVTHGQTHSCLCAPSYTGLFCQVLWCEMDPCVMGRCFGTPEGFRCQCQMGWGGDRCDKKVSPCAKNPCQGRGECTIVNNTFSCRCHAWWEGTRCEKRMVRIPYKPLSERMIEEPFWLGLITVAVVMGCIGVAFCIKKHFAEKIEKFFAEEIEKSKYGGVSGGSRLNPLPSPTGLSPRPRPKSLFVRLNSFRKASLLSLSSTASSPPGDGQSFAFDDFLKPHKRGSGGSNSPRRVLSKSRSQTASPRIDSKKILRHLITPPVGHRAPSFDDFLNLRTQSSKCSVVSDEYRRLRSASPEVPSRCTVVIERALSADMSELQATGGLSGEIRRSSGGDPVRELVDETSLISLAPSPTKHDKRVTFAKLLKKMSKEVSSSSSDVSAAEDRSSAKTLTLSASNSRRSPRRSLRFKQNIRCSGSGSGEEFAETPDISSSEMTPDPPKKLLSIISVSSPTSKTSSPQNKSKLNKISSADSLLAMFRSIGGTGRSSISSPTSPQCSEFDDSSAQCSPSTTPTTPPRMSPAPPDTLCVPGGTSHQVQVHGQPGNGQFSGPMITLEVPSDQYRCLSPITELPSPMPTPMPSPLPTPCRHHVQQRGISSQQKINVNTSSESSAQDTESEFSVTVSIERSSSDSSSSEPKAFFASHGYQMCNAGDSHLNSSHKPTCSSPLNNNSTKNKYKPPPLNITNSNLLNFHKQNAKDDMSLCIPMIRVHDEEGDILEHFDTAPRTRSQSVDVGAVLKTPLITVFCVDDSPPSSPSSSSKSDISTISYVVPTLSVTVPSPPAIYKNPMHVPTIIAPTETPVNRYKGPFGSALPFRRRSHTQLLDKTNSLDFPSQAPSIVVTTTMSEFESDLDTPLEKMAPNSSNSRFLSPLFVGNIHATSEGNLSSSGYSSAYSSGPSRCSSNNKLCSEIEEPVTPSATSIHYKPPALPATKNILSNESQSFHLIKRDMPKVYPLLRTDSETTDDPGIFSQPDSALEQDTNDEEIQNQTIDESASLIISQTSLIDEAQAQRNRLLMSSSHSFPKESPRLQRAPPAIIVHNSLQSESSLEENISTEKNYKLSPVSSRSESPISDSRLSVHKIYPAFFSSKGKLDMPYTDSDGLYDCPSSEVLHSDSTKSTPLRRLGRRKTKRAAKLKNFLGTTVGCERTRKSSPNICGNASGNDKIVSSLELPPWGHMSHRRSSQKRRVRAQINVDFLSSSSDSVSSQSTMGGNISSPAETFSDIGCHAIEEEDTKKISLKVDSKNKKRRNLVRGDSASCKNLNHRGSIDASGEDTQEEKFVIDAEEEAEGAQRHRKLSRFRTFSNQLKFIRRLQRSKSHQREHLVISVDSSDSDQERKFKEAKQSSQQESKSSTAEITQDTDPQVMEIQMIEQNKIEKVAERNTYSN